jgi:hypothetical protein
MNRKDIKKIVREVLLEKRIAAATAGRAPALQETYKPSLKIILKEMFEQENEPTESATDKKRIFVLVGPPSVGKSSWIANTFEEEPYVINRDDIVEDVASSYGWTYDDMFVNPPPDAQVGETDPKYGTVEPAPSWMTWAKTVFSKVQEANNRVQTEFKMRVAGAPSSEQDIVVDMTNMNAGARKGALAAISGQEGEYEKIAVVFEFEGAEDAIRNVAARRAEAAQRMGKSKTIPDAAFQRMFASFSRPTESEGFDQIVSVDNRELLNKLANDEASETPTAADAAQSGIDEHYYPEGPERGVSWDDWKKLTPEEEEERDREDRKARARRDAHDRNDNPHSLHDPAGHWLYESRYPLNSKRFQKLAGIIKD